MPVSLMLVPLVVAGARWRRGRFRARRPLLRGGVSTYRCSVRSRRAAPECPTLSSTQVAASIVPATVLESQAATTPGLPAESGVGSSSTSADWPPDPGLALEKEAAALDASASDMEAIGLAADGQGQALIYWSRQLAKVLRQAADGASWDAVRTDSVEWEGSSYELGSFIQEGTGEWGAALQLTAEELGIPAG